MTNEVIQSPLRFPVSSSAIPAATISEEDGSDLPRLLPHFPIVCVGASAGGLAAYSKLLANLTPDTGMAFVLVQHLSPQYESQMAHLLSKVSKMPVAEAIEGTSVCPNHVYVIPPNFNMALEGGVLRMTQRDSTRGPHLSIDIFMRSLALELGNRAIGIVLSGTGADGTLGLAEIKAVGGITFAQDPASAECGEMPASAISYGCSDFTLNPEEIAHEVILMSHHPYLHDDRAFDIDPFPNDQASYHAVLGVLQQTSHIDFTLYRTATIKRRILRRMAVKGIPLLSDYSMELSHNLSEAKALLKDVLINVTSFFRNRVVFDAIEALIFPHFVNVASENSSIRIWVVACSTGQEAYSLAISLIEYLDSIQSHMTIQIFATDISEGCLMTARAGIYPASIEEEVSSERLKRHFTRVQEGYRINKSIRDLCVFAKHDITADTPFSKIDLISCRNVLIYLTPTLQARVMPILCYTLNTGGFLVLGNSETVGRSSDLFDAIDSKNRIYIKKSGTSRVHPPVFSAIHKQLPDSLVSSLRSPTIVELQRAADRIVLNRYAPAGVLIDGEMNIIQFRGKTSPFLDPMQGQASLSLLKMVPIGLSQELGKAIEEAKQLNITVRKKSIRLRDEFRLREIDFEVSLVRLPGSQDPSILILFEETPNVGQISLPLTSGAPSSGTIVNNLAPNASDYGQLKQELATANGYLESLVEENNAVNDELRFANDETTSANEELRCTNEELQTAKEEVESSNEELATLNEELRGRNMELTQIGDDLTNLLGGIDQPVIMLGLDLRIRKLAGPTAQLLRLTLNDIGRHVENLDFGFSGPSFEKTASEVIQKHFSKEVEIRDRSGRWFSMRITPYRTEGDIVSGAVATFIDIDVVKRSQESLRKSGDAAKSIIETVRTPLLVLNGELLVQTANRAFCQLYGLPLEGILDQHLCRLSEGEWNIPDLKRLLLGVLKGDGQLEDFEVTHTFANLGTRTVLLSAGLLETAIAGSRTIVLAIADVTRQKQMTDKLLKRSSDLQHSNTELEHFATIASHDLQEPLRMITSYTDLLKSRLHDQLDNRSKEYMEYVLNGGTRMRDLIQAILRYSKVGNHTLKATIVDSLTIARLAAVNIERKIIEANASVEFEPLPTVHADPVLLTQLFQNLMSNGIKFKHRDRNPVIAIKGTTSESEWIFSVADNGIGIRAEDSERIFTIFQRVHSTAEYPGTGIGLATCKKIVEIHGGRIWLDSTIEVGSTFFFSLPKR